MDESLKPIREEPVDPRPTPAEAEQPAGSERDALVETVLPGDVHLHAPLDDVPALARLFPREGDPFVALPDAEIVKQSRHRFVVRVQVQTAQGPRILYGKRYKSKRLSDRILRYVRGSRAEREYRIVLRTRERGIATPSAVAWGEREHPYESYVLLQAADPAPSLYDLIEQWRDEPDALSFSERRHILCAVSAAVAEMHAKGLKHDDLSAQHLLVQQTESGEMEVFVIDLDNARFPGRMTPEMRAHNLAQIARSLQPVGLCRRDAVTLLHAYLDAWKGNHHDWKTWWRYLDGFVQIRRRASGGLNRYLRIRRLGRRWPLT